MSEPSEQVVQRATELLCEFMAWTPDIGPCPIHVNSGPWLTRLCGEMEKRAALEIAIKNAEMIETQIYIGNDPSSVYKCPFCGGHAHTLDNLRYCHAEDCPRYNDYELKE